MSHETAMAKHTPGLWKIDERPFSLYGVVHISCGRYIVAKALGKFPSCEIEAQANARLIAAAPELLESLKEARDYVRDDLKNIGPCEHDVGHCVCGILSMLHRMEEAIAKAEGRS